MMTFRRFHSRRCLWRAAILCCGLLAFAPGAPADPPPASSESEPESGRALRLEAATLPALGLLDTSGKSHDFQPTYGRVTVVLFLSCDCPISNRYIPELNRLATHADYAGVRWYGVISDATVTLRDAAEYHREYKLKFPLLFDSSGEAARHLRPTHTPEAFVFDGEGELIYRGRIDDRFPDVQYDKGRAKRHDLEEAVKAAIRGKKVAVPRTAPVGCPWEPPPAPLGNEVTFNRHIAPIIFRRCTPCHRKGQVAPFPLETYRDAAKRRGWIAEVTRRRLMPPWKAAPGHGEFANNWRLSDRELALLRTWADAGAPEGAAEDLPPVPRFDDGWKLGKPDLVLKVPQPFPVPAGGPDIYQYFVLPLGLEKDRYVRAVEFQPGNPRVVHHAIFLLDDRQRARKLDERDPGLGYQRFGGPGFLPSGGIGGWAPGMQPIVAPLGAARKVPAGSDLVFQIHYHPSGKAETDQSEVAVYFAEPPVDREIGGIPLINRKFVIPAGAREHKVTTTFRLPTDVRLLSITPHMHYRGKQMKVDARLPDGSQRPLIWITEWDWNWQLRYEYAVPLELPAGTVIHLEAIYDNSSDNPANPVIPPVEVRWGDATEDEMCLCFLEITTDRPEQIRLLRRRMLLQELVRDPLLWRRFTPGAYQEGP